MNYEQLPYLQSLKAALDSIATQFSVRDMPKHVSVSRKLLDFMIGQDVRVPDHQAEFRKGLAELLPAIEAELGSAMPRPEAVTSSSTFSASSNLRDFAQHMRFVADIQRALLGKETAESAALRATILRLESEYARKCLDAFANPLQPAADPATEPGTTSSEPLDTDGLLRFLHEAFPDERGVRIEQCKATSGGYSKMTLDITLSGVQTLPPNIILRSDVTNIYSGSPVAVEYGLMKALHDDGVCVPRPLALDDTASYTGAPFMLMDKVPGISLGNMLDLPGRCPDICRDMARRLALVHKVPVERVAQCFTGGPSRTSEKVLVIIEQEFAAWEALDMPSAVFEAAFSWLRRNAKLNDDAPPALVHGDYGLQNILVQDRKASAILDWEFSYIGNPAFDLGYFYDQAEDMDSWPSFLQAYAVAGAPLPNEDQLNYNILFAALRMGVIAARMRQLFVSGGNVGIDAAWTVSEAHYETFVTRIAAALARVA